MTLTYVIRSGTSAARSGVVVRGRGALNTLVQLTLRDALDDRRFLARGATLAFPCSHLYHKEARFQRKQRPLSRQTLSALKGRDQDVAAAAMAEGLEVTLYPYMIETCADETWQLDHFPTPREEAALGDQMDPTDLENALAIRVSSEEVSDFDVVWVEPPPHFNAQPTMYVEMGDRRLHAVDPDLPALTHFHACEYSATGYFGNEGSDIDLYFCCALHVEIPPYGEGARGVSGTGPSLPASSRGGQKGSGMATPRKKSTKPGARPGTR